MKKILPLLLLFLACAKQGMPPGGPQDKTGPTIIETIPKSDSLNIPLNQKITIIFDEMVEQNSCENSIFITPYLGDDVKFKWKRGRRLTIIPQKDLVDNRTYTVTIGTATKDLRNNPMKESFTLAFSTGDSLDRAELTGFAKAARTIIGTQIWAYDKSEIENPNPMKEPPLYITQVNKDGTYKIPNMAFGDYRVYAVNDRDENGLYDPEYDMIGMTTSDVLLNAAIPQKANMNFYVALKDTTPPVLRDIVAIDQHHLDLQFNEFMKSDSLINTDNFEMYRDDKKLHILNAVIDPQNSSVVHLFTELQTDSLEYFIDVKNAFDLAGHFLNKDSSTFSFNTTVIPDTNKPTLKMMTPADSSKLVPKNIKLDFWFSEAMDTSSFINHFTIHDTLGQSVSTKIEWEDLSHVSIAIDEIVKDSEIYFAEFPVDSVFDAVGNSWGDTLFTKTIFTTRLDTLTGLSGAIIDEDTSATGPFNITITSTDDYSYTKWFNNGKYDFQDIMPGIYLVNGYRDENENGEYDMGNVYPYEPSERFLVYPDSISIRSRWSKEGYDVTFPRR